MEDFSDALRSKSSIRERNLFFIVGAAKSGTTWLQKLLDAHPEICCKGESHLANRLAPEIEKLLQNHNNLIASKNNMLEAGQDGYPMFTAEHAEIIFACAASLLLDAQLAGGEAKCLGEKTPDHVCTLPLLARIFPGARFIHIIRDGRDAAVSGWHHIYRDSPEWARENFPTFARYAGVYASAWVTYVEQGRAFGSLHADRYHEVRYEQLHRDSTGVLAALLRFLQMDASPRMVERCISAGSFERLSKGRQPGDEDAGSHFRKGIVGDWRNHFDKESKAIFERHGGKLLQRLGYA